jgi:hypothetical protein
MKIIIEYKQIKNEFLKHSNKFKLYSEINFVSFFEEHSHLFR